jgi:hypothetical protein
MLGAFVKMVGSWYLHANIVDESFKGHHHK